MQGGDLFIVDNSVSGWTALRYLEQWTEISTHFDVATGYFELGALLALDGKWQQLKTVRILMGDETTQRTKKLLLEAIEAKARSTLNQSLEDQKKANPFLDGVEDIVKGLLSGQIQVKIFNQSKFHAKTYITHSKLEVVGSKALVGSSNFTAPGLAGNVELNVQIQSPSEVSQLQRWYETHWEEAEDVTPEIVTTITPHIKQWSPYEIYTKSLLELFRGRESSVDVWEECESAIFPLLDQYQKEAYWALVKIAKRFNGAFLCDGVGLGKTFVGLMLIERLIREKKHVVLLAPKSAREGVWEPKLRQLLPMLFGTDFSNLAIFSHTDLQRGAGFVERFARVSEIADVVIIDEAHHFRNPGVEGDEETGQKRSRYNKLLDVIHNGNSTKTVFMLTATPINNRLADLRHLIEIFTNRDEQYFAKTLGVHSLKGHFSKLERDLHELLGDSVDLENNLVQLNDLLSDDEIFENLIVQRSRAYAVESQRKEHGNAALFPRKNVPKVIEYSIGVTYGNLLELVARAFSRASPLFKLAVYDPVEYYLGDPDDIDNLERGRRQNIVSLIRTQFLKRFESSVYAFETSCYRLLKKLIAFQYKHCVTDNEQQLLGRWSAQNRELLSFYDAKQQEFGEAELDEAELVSSEMLDAWDLLDRKLYDVQSIIQETFLDLAEITKFLEETRRFNADSDDKLKNLLNTLRSDDFAHRKVIIFTEFVDTARYVETHLKNLGLSNVDRIDGGTSGQRYEAVKRFAPYYNESSSPELASEGIDEIQILIATDVLAEGLNLQDCTRLINYDIHWNPVRLMQRIGRIDRRLDAAIEDRIVFDHPNLREDRGTVSYWNFLPPAELNQILSLYQRVTHKTLMISKTMGIEGRKLLTPDDEYEALKEFNAGYEGERTQEENLHLEVQALLENNPDLESKVASMPGSAFSGRASEGKSANGIFYCFRLPTWDPSLNEFSLEAGPVRWYFHNFVTDQIVENVFQINELIQCDPAESRHCVISRESLMDSRSLVKRYIKNSYLKRLEAPIGVEPYLLTWMEVS